MFTLRVAVPAFALMIIAAALAALAITSNYGGPPPCDAGSVAALTTGCHPGKTLIIDPRP